jgi:hypothetical protein
VKHGEAGDRSQRALYPEGVWLPSPLNTNALKCNQLTSHRVYLLCTQTSLDGEILLIEEKGRLLIITNLAPGKLLLGPITQPLVFLLRGAMFIHE